MAPVGNKLAEVAPGDCPVPTPGVDSFLKYNGATETRENVPALMLDLDGAVGGDNLKMSDDLLSLEVFTPHPITTSVNATDNGRMLIGNGTALADDAAVPIVMRAVAPTPSDGFDGLLWWDSSAKLLYGPRGKDTAGQWGTGYNPFTPRPSEYLSAEIAAGTFPISPATFILQVKDIEESGGFTQDANGVTIPVAGSYRITYSFLVENNSGFEAEASGKLLINGALPATNGREWAVRTETSRWPTVTITLRTTLAAGDVLAVEGSSIAYTLDASGTAGGVLIERVGD